MLKKIWLFGVSLTGGAERDDFNQIEKSVI
jgi:hypothetical protein